MSPRSGTAATNFRVLCCSGAQWSERHCHVAELVTTGTGAHSVGGMRQENAMTKPNLSDLPGPTRALSRCRRCQLGTVRLLRSPDLGCGGGVVDVQGLPIPAPDHLPLRMAGSPVHPLVPRDLVARGRPWNSGVVRDNPRLVCPVRVRVRPPAAGAPDLATSGTSTKCSSRSAESESTCGGQSIRTATSSTY